MTSVVRRSLIGGCLLVLLALLGSCTENDAEVPTNDEDAVTFTDDLGRTVRLEAPARRIVSLAPNLTEIVYAAGAGDRLVGVGTADDYPPSVDTLSRLSTLPVDFEALARLHPDLILANTAINSPRDVDTFEALGAPAVYLAFDSVAAIFDAVRHVGHLAGTSVTADAAADSLTHAFRRIEQTVPRHERPRTLFLIGDETLYAFGRHSYVQDIIAAAGGRSLTAQLDRRAPVLSEEFVLEQQPEVIVGAWGEDYDPRRLAELHPSWHSVPAIERGRVYSVEPDVVLRPGPRIVEGARRLAAILRPEQVAATP